jgi:SAM-dependent methyltransferase
VIEMADWAPTFFTHLYSEVYRGPLFDKAATESEVGLLSEVFADCKGMVLDVGAGFGRHAGPLARKGIKVVALDRFRHLLAKLPRRGRTAVQADMRNLPVANASLGGAYCIFNTFGYFDKQDNARVIAGIGRALAPGGKFVLQCPNRPVMARITREFPPMRMLSNKASLTESYHYDEDAKALVGRGHWQVGDAAQSWEFSLRLYTRGEIGRLLNAAGLQVIEEFGSLRPRELFAPRTSTEMILVCQKG